MYYKQSDIFEFVGMYRDLYFEGFLSKFLDDFIENYKFR